MQDWHNRASGKIAVRVIPKASANRIKAEISAAGDFLLRIYVTVPPEDGKANAAVINLLAKELHLPKSAICIVQGHTARDKVVEIRRAGGL